MALKTLGLTISPSIIVALVAYLSVMGLVALVTPENLSYASATMFGLLAICFAPRILNWLASCRRVDVQDELMHLKQKIARDELAHRHYQEDCRGEGESAGAVCGPPEKHAKPVYIGLGKVAH